MDSKVQCPKCKVSWPKSKDIKYCICGAKLPTTDFSEFFGDVFGDVMESFGSKQKKQGESDGQMLREPHG